MVSTDEPNGAPLKPTPEGDAVESTESAPGADAASESSTPAAAPTVPQRVQRRRDRLRKRIDRSVLEFQPDVVELEYRRVPGGTRWTLYVVILLIMATIGWAWWAEVDKIVVGQGQLITHEAVILIQPASQAPIRSIEVGFGDIVKENQILATLDPTFSAADVARLQANADALEARVGRLHAEHQDLPALDVSAHADKPDWQMELQVFEQRRAEYEAKLKEFEAEQQKVKTQINTNTNEIAGYEEQLKIVDQLVEQARHLLDRSAGSLNDLLQRQFTKVQTEQQLTTARNKALELAEELNAVEKRQAAYVANRRATIADEYVKARQEFKEVSEELTKAIRLSDLTELRVPDNLSADEFVVLEVTDRSVGSVVQPGDSLFKLVPLNTPLEVEVEIQGKDVGLINPGQDEARIKLAAFPYQRHGTLVGRVRTISEGVFPKGDENVQAPSVYKARIELTTTELQNVPEYFRLVPGMAATAEIKIGKRRVISYFLYPIIRHWDESIREP
jgi:HlyD family secretion protein